jgi:hypothetical protein
MACNPGGEVTAETAWPDRGRAAGERLVAWRGGAAEAERRSLGGYPRAQTGEATAHRLRGVQRCPVA